MGFNGASLFEASEIKEALYNYKEGFVEAQELLEQKIKECEDKFTPSWWQKLIGIKTLRKYHEDSTTFSRYHSFVIKRYPAVFDEEFWDKVEPFNCYKKGKGVHLSYWETEFAQLGRLSDEGTKDVYVNANQVAFVRNWRNKCAS